MKKRISFSKIVTKRHDIFTKLTTGDDFTHLPNVLFIGANLHSDFANIKRIPKNVKNSSAYYLYEYIDLESFLLKRTHVEMDFIEYAQKSSTFKKVAEKYLNSMDELIISFLNSVGNEEAEVVLEDDQYAVIKIVDWGFFTVSKEVLGRLGPVAKNILDENIIGLTKYLQVRNVVKKCF